MGVVACSDSGQVADRTYRVMGAFGSVGRDCGSFQWVDVSMGGWQPTTSNSQTQHPNPGRSPPKLTLHALFDYIDTGERTSGRSRSKFPACSQHPS